MPQIPFQIKMKKIAWMALDTFGRDKGIWCLVAPQTTRRQRNRTNLGSIYAEIKGQHKTR